MPMKNMRIFLPGDNANADAVVETLGPVGGTANSEETETGTSATTSISNDSTVSDVTDWSERHIEYKKEARVHKFIGVLRASVLRDSLRTGTQLVKMYRREDWIKSFRHLDPRFQILMYFDEVARQGGPMEDPLALAPRIALLHGFAKASAFTVWRPTSREAKYQMMKGEVTGKGLDVKGKSARGGKISGLIPFLQIHSDEDKKKARWPPRDARISIFYKTSELRNAAEKAFNSTALEMGITFAKAKESLVFSSSDTGKDERESALENMVLLVEDSQVHQLNDSGFGLDVAQRVFFETYINSQDITIKGTEYANGRPSEPAFQDMNFECTRKYSGSGPRAVVFQTCGEDALRPQSIVIAYEENGSVTPVASDFDCFTVGTRGVAFDSPLPAVQVELVKWLVHEIETLLESPQTDKAWTSCWLQVLKDNAAKGFHPKMPTYGYGDPKSYAIMEGAVARFKYNGNGAVRHGSECFNFYFPQELDEEFLVISDSLKGNVPWKHVNAEELKEFLFEKIDEDFCFPLNPKWILADRGWKKIYDKMMASTCKDTQISLNSWYPKDSGIRELFESVHERFPNGFQRLVPSADDNGKQSTTTMNGDEAMNGDDAMSLVEQKLRQHLVKEKAFLKVRSGVILFNQMSKLSDLSQIQSKSSLRKESQEIEETVSGENANADAGVESYGDFAPVPVEDVPGGDNESDNSLPSEIGGNATRILELDNVPVEKHGDSQSHDAADVASVHLATNSSVVVSDGKDRQSKQDRYSDQPTSTTFASAQSLVSSSRQLQHVTFASRSKPARKSSRGRSNQEHDQLYGRSLAQRHEVESSHQKRAKERTGKLTTSNTGYDHVSLQRRRHSEKRESLKAELAKPEQKITIAQAGRLYDRLVMHKDKIE